MGRPLGCLGEEDCRCCVAKGIAPARCSGGLAGCDAPEAGAIRQFLHHQAPAAGAVLGGLPLLWERVLPLPVGES